MAASVTILYRRFVAGGVVFYEQFGPDDRPDGLVGGI